MHLKKLPDEMLSGMMSSDVTELMAFTNIEPWGEERQDLRNAMLNCTIVDLMKKEGDEPANPADYMIVKDIDEPELLTLQEQADKINTSFSNF